MSLKMSMPVYTKQQVGVAGPVRSSSLGCLAYVSAADVSIAESKGGNRSIRPIGNVTAPAQVICKLLINAYTLRASTVN
jgi:hypothetical protein